MHITDKTDGSTHAIFRGCVEVKVRYDWMQRHYIVSTETVAEWNLSLY